MKRPLPVTILGCLFIVTGALGLVFHLLDNPLDRWVVVISLVSMLSLLGGVFLLKGRSCARWLLLAWVAFHVVLRWFHSLSQFSVHLVLLAVVAYFLLWSSASKYFEAVAPDA
jgi:hypothetical protein